MSKTARWMMVATCAAAAVASQVDGVLDRPRLYEFASYATLYHPADTPVIRDFSSEREGQLVLDVHGATGPWAVRDAGGEHVDVDLPILALSEGRAQYSAHSQSASVALRLGIDHLPKAKDRANQRGQSHVYEVNVPIGVFDQLPVQDFISGGFDAGELAEAKKRLVAFGLIEGASTKDRLERVAAFILSELNGRGGMPEAWMQDLNGFHQFDAARAKKSQVDCRNLSAIFEFYAHAAGISMRRIALFGRLGTAILSAHAMNEAFVPERGVWVAADLVARLAWVEGGEGRPVNTIDLQHAVITRNYGSLAARVVRDDGSVESAPYASVAPTHEQYLSQDVTIEFYRGRPNQSRRTPRAVLGRILKPDLAYALNASNDVFIAQRFIAAVGVVLFGYLFWVVVRSVRSRRRR